MATLANNTPLATLGEIIHAALTFSHDAWESGGNPGNPPASGPQLSNDIRALFSLFNERRASYLLVGGVALLKYIDGRNTQDIDLLLSADSLEKVPEIAIADRNDDFARGGFRSVRVDLSCTRNPLFKLVHQYYATVHRFAEIDVPCATVEGLILLKFYAISSLYRQGDGQRIGIYETDIAMLYEVHRPALAPLLAIVQKYVDAGAADELKNIVADIEKRIARVDAARDRC